MVESVVSGAIQRLTAAAWGVSGAIASREFFQHYGLTSCPKPGAEVILIRDGGSIIAIASDDRRYRITLEEGECALYDDLGQKVHLTREGIVASSPTRITASAPHIDLVATSRVHIDTPLLEVTGDITSGGDVSDSKGSMDAMRDIYNAHTQAVSGGVAQAPASRMI